MFCKLGCKVSPQIMIGKEFNDEDEDCIERFEGWFISNKILII